MEKVKCNIKGPIDHYSVYGDKCRQMIKSLICLYPNWEISIIPTIDRESQGRYLKDHNEQSLLKLSQTDGSFTPDISIQFDDGNRLTKRGNINVGVVLTDNLIDGNDQLAWINGCNQMDYVIVFSEYSKQNLSNLNIENIKITSPIVILNEYSNIFDLPNENVNSILPDQLKSNWNFLLEGYWDVKESEQLGSKNKMNMTFAINTFLNIFKDIPGSPGLILHVKGKYCSKTDKKNIIDKIQAIREGINHSIHLPEIYLIYGDLTPLEELSLYTDNRIHALINISQREDCVGNVLNFLPSRKPIIYSNWSALKELLSWNGNHPVNGEIKQLFKNGPTVINIYTAEFKSALYDMFYHYEDYEKNASQNGKLIINNRSKDNYLNILKQFFK